MQNAIIEKMRETLPPLVARDEVADLCNPHLGGIFKRFGMITYHRNGNAPKYIKVGRRIYYKREDFLEWVAKSFLN